MIVEKTTGTAITPEIKDELLNLIQEGLERHEQKKEADKTVFRRVCGSLVKELNSFNYIVPDEYTDRNGKKVTYNREVPCWYKIETALSTLVRTVYRVDAVAKLPSEGETDIKQFMLDTLERMKALGESNTADKDVMNNFQS